MTSSSCFNTYFQELPGLILKFLALFDLPICRRYRPKLFRRSQLFMAMAPMAQCMNTSIGSLFSVAEFHREHSGISRNIRENREGIVLAQFRKSGDSRLGDVAVYAGDERSAERPGTTGMMSLVSFYRLAKTDPD